MIEMNMPGITRRRPGRGPVKKHSLKTDMTPMVDLGFLLITFFVMTVQLSKPAVVNLNMPKDGPPMPVGNSNALTVLIDNNDRVYYYEGDWKKARETGQIFKTNLSVTNGLGQIIRKKQATLDAYDQKEGRRGLMLMIRASHRASYKNVIDALDEALINVVEKYAVLPAEPGETEWMERQQ
jgi:biopolymer transport protein ExbD